MNTTQFKNDMSLLITTRNIQINTNNLPIQEWPTSIIKIVIAQAKSAASIQCAIRNYACDLSTYDNHITCGTIPQDLEFKFKKLYPADEDVSYKAAMLEQAIKAEKSRIDLKLKNLNALNDARLESLSLLIKDVVQACNLIIDPAIMKVIFEFQILQWKAEFITKQVKNDAKKVAKETAMSLAKEDTTKPAIITAKELKSLNATISNLTKKVAQMTTKASPKKVAGNKKRVTLAPRKPTGDTKRKSGELKATAKVKKSPGKSGK